MKRIKISTKKSYEVVIENSFSNLSQEVKKVFSGEKILILSDLNVSSIYGEQVKNCLSDYDVYEVNIKGGEECKSMGHYIELLEKLASYNFSRKDCVFALGGGVVGDLAGFVASTYMRGIKFIQCPTSLLAQVDSSVGGKTAVNLAHGKNLVGAFYQPELVYINTKTIETLPEREIQNGMGEIVKYAFISSTVRGQSIVDRDYETLINDCVNVKADVVGKDEFENGLRAVLNLGHTIGHAIESLSNYRLPHGNTVAKGIKLIIKASKKYYGFSDEKEMEMQKLLNAYPFDFEIPYTKEQILQKIYNDKKAVGENVSAVLIKDVGKVEIIKMPIQEFGELIDEI